jgi:hypothetical protein
MRSLLLLPLLFWPLLSFAVKGYRAGDELHVLALSGIRLRAAPGSDKVLATLPYGAKVAVAEVLSPAQPFEAEGIRGFWVKVKSKEQVGYVFDGFLSWLPAPDKSCIDLATYAQKHLKPQGAGFVGHAFGCYNPEEDAISGSDQTRFFQYGSATIVLTESYYYEGGGEGLSLNGGAGFSLEEGWLLARAIFKADLDHCIELIAENPDQVDFNDRPVNAASYQQFTPAEEGNFLELDMMPEGCSDTLIIVFDPQTKTVYISRSSGC